VAYRLKTIGERGGADEPIVEVPDVEGESAAT
jgi:hypothetical protein